MGARRYALIGPGAVGLLYGPGFRDAAEPLRVLALDLIDDTKTALARAWLQLIFLAYHALQMIHAIVITIVRVAVTHRKMLEWQTAATAGRQHGQAMSETRMFVRQMLGSPMFATAAFKVTRALKLHQNLLQKFDWEILF